jgi:nitroreductase
VNAMSTTSPSLPSNPVAERRSRAKVLPPPHTRGGMPLMEALALRRSTREYASRALPLQSLSDLLWAAYGINRADCGDYTAPYWRHIAVLDVYVAMTDGVWRYSPERHLLMPHLPVDLRAATGLQDFVGTAPVNLIYVAHGDRMHDLTPEQRRLYASVDAAFIGQNVYLYCAGSGLASVFRGAFDEASLAKAMHLGADEFITFTQTVGYPRHAESDHHG